AVAPRLEAVREHHPAAAIEPVEQGIPLLGADQLPAGHDYSGPPSITASSSLTTSARPNRTGFRSRFSARCSSVRIVRSSMSPGPSPPLAKVEGAPTRP